MLAQEPYTVFRKVEEKDLLDLYHNLYLKQTNSGHDHESVKYEYEDFKTALKDERAIFMLYEDGDYEDVFGFILAYDLKSWIYLDILCVNEKYRNQGIGQAFLSYLKTQNECVIGCYYTEDEKIKKFLEKNNCSFWQKQTTWFKL